MPPRAQAPRGGCWIPEEEATRGTLWDVESEQYVPRPARFFRGGSFLPNGVTHIAIMYSAISYDGGLSASGQIAVYSPQQSVPVYGVEITQGEPVYIGRPVLLIVPVGSNAAFIESERVRLWQDIEAALHGSP